MAKDPRTVEARIRARAQVRQANEKAKRIFEAVKKNVSSNVDVINEMTDGFLADDDHDIDDCAKDMFAATVACWGNTCDMWHEVVKACLPEKDPSSSS
jgi:hypothetical protein